MARITILDSKGQPLTKVADDRAKIWQERLTSANEYYDTWSEKYEVEKLERYYYGDQWEQAQYEEYRPYTHNKFFVAIDVKMPSLLFQNPKFTVKPKPTKAEFDEEGANMRSKLRQDILNFYFKTHQVDWGVELDLSILNAQFAFGIVEVLFTSDWIENPDADKPLYLSDIEQDVMLEEDEIIKRPKRVPTKEQAVIKRIPSNRFRVSTLDHAILDRCGWYAYWEYIRTVDLENNENYDTSEFNMVVSASSDFSEGVALQDELEQQVLDGDLVKMWKIFDPKSKTIEYWPDGHDNIVRTRRFKHNPIIPLKFRNRLSGFYPLPPTFNWISPQDEINDVRETTRLHRKRYIRKFITAKGGFEPEEFEKLQYGGDGTYVESKFPDVRAVIGAVPNADLGGQHNEALQVSASDFDNIAGVTAEQQGAGGSDTATEAKIVDSRAKIRESRERKIVAEFLSAIAKQILLEVKDRTTLDFWIKVSADERDDESQIGEITESWEKITKDDMLGDEDFDVDITVSSLSPITQQEDKAAFIEFLSIVQQFPIVSMSPHLIRETADKLNYRNENVIRVLQKLAQAIMLEQIAKAEGTLRDIPGATGGAGAGQLGQKTVAQATPNTSEQIRNQLGNQSTTLQ